MSRTMLAAVLHGIKELRIVTLILLTVVGVLHYLLR